MSDQENRCDCDNQIRFLPPPYQKAKKKVDVFLIAFNIVV